MKKISIKITTLKDATNEYNENVLNSELENYLTTSCMHTLNKERIILNIYGLENKEEEKEIINLIHKHYETKAKQLKKIDKYDDYFRFLLLILGIILIIISEQLTSFLSEIFLIAGWVVIWEMVYDILFTGIKRKKDLKIYKKLSQCEITFFKFQV